MNDQNLRNAFMELASEEVPEDMDLWSDIQAQLAQPPKQKNRFVMTFARVAIAIFALTSFSIVGYALYQTIPDQSLSEDIITPLNLSQTIDDVTVTLEWAYADVNRIALQYSSEYAKELNPLTFYDIELTDAEGNSIPNAFGGGGGGGGGGSADEPISIMANLNFDPTGIINADEIDLILRLKVADGQFAVPMFKNDLMMTRGVVPGGVGTGSGGGGGGGGGTSADTPPAQEQRGGGGGGGVAPMMLPTEISEDVYVREFEIAFSLSMYPEVSVDVSNVEPVSDSNITVTLTDLTYTPSSTEANLCFEGMPEPAIEWIPRVTIGNSSRPDLTTGTQLLPSGEPSCYDVIGFILTRPDVQTITVSVNGLESWANVERPDSSPEAFAARLEERGVIVNLTEMPDGGMMVEIDHERTEVSNEEANEIFQQVQMEQMPKPNVYEGEWVFEVPVN